MKDRNVVIAEVTRVRSFYLTLVSIIQSLTLGYLLNKYFEILARGEMTVILTIHSLCSLIAIILIWHEYAVGADSIKWRVDFIDSETSEKITFVSLSFASSV